MGRYGVWEGNDVACVMRISATTFNKMNDFLSTHTSLSYKSNEC